MRVVVDLGCASHGRADSLRELVREYEPDVIYGFDPMPTAHHPITDIDGVPAVIEQVAVGTYDGEVGFIQNDWASRVVEGHGVRCIDFTRWLVELRRRPEVTKVYVKMDIEGAEVPIVEKLIDTRADHLIDELLVEWHGAGEHLEEQLSCPVRRWWM